MNRNLRGRLDRLECQHETKNKLPPQFWDALFGAVLFGYIARLGLMTAVVLVVRTGGWFATVPFAITLLVTHLGLLVWESTRVSASLAFPGLKPAPGSQVTPEENHSK